MSGDNKKLGLALTACAIAVGFAMLSPYSWISYLILALGYSALGVIAGRFEGALLLALLLPVFGGFQGSIDPVDGSTEIHRPVILIWMLAIPLWTAAMVLGTLAQPTARRVRSLASPDE